MTRHIRALRDERLSLLVGAHDFRLLRIYIEGYRASLRDERAADDYPVFVEWLERKYVGLRTRGWQEVLLEQTGNDDAAALKLFADEAAAFLAERTGT